MLHATCKSTPLRRKKHSRQTNSGNNQITGNSFFRQTMRQTVFAESEHQIIKSCQNKSIYIIAGRKKTDSHKRFNQNNQYNRDKQPTARKIYFVNPEKLICDQTHDKNYYSEQQPEIQLQQNQTAETTGKKKIS